MKLTLERQITLGFIISSIILVVIIFFTYRSLNSLNESLYWEKHTQQVLLQVDETFILMVNAESAVRGFLILQDENLLEPLQQARQNAESSMTKLGELTKDNPKQGKRVAELSQIIRERLEFFDEIINSRRQNSLEDTVSIFRQSRGRELSNNIRRLTDEIKSEEQSLLTERESILNNNLQNSRWMVYVIGFAGIISIGLANLAIYREIGKRRIVEEEIRETNKNLETRIADRTREISEKNTELAENEIFRRAILDSLSAHIAVIDREGNIIAVNNAWEKFAQANSIGQQIGNTGVGQNYLKVCENLEDFDEATQKIIENLRKVLDGESDGFGVEYPCHSPTEERWFLLQVNSLKNEKGGAVVSHINITDRRKAEDSLKNSEEFTRSIFESSPDCVKILELDGTLHSMNTNGLCIMEIDDFSGFQGKQWVDFWEGDENEMAYQAVETARKGETSRFEGFCRTAKGTMKYWDVSVAPIFDATGKPVRLISTSRDITERKEAEKSKFHLAAIVESSNDAIISKDLNGIITSWNRGAENLFGYRAKEVIGKSVTILIPPDHLDEEPQILERIRRGEKVVFYETTRMRKNKSRVETSLTVSPIFDYAGKIIGASKIAHDISERRQAELEREQLLKSEQSARKEAEIANRMRDEFLATVSHELRAPLNSILGWGRLLEKGNLDESTSAKALQTIIRNAESQNRLIEDLLDVSRIISGKLRLEVTTIKPIIFVESALETIRPAAEAKNISLEIIEDSVVSQISGDPNRLQQIVWNLLSNAIKFTPVGGKVTVQIKLVNGYTEIRVIDTGVGISQEFLSHVFDRFRQADASSIRKFGGLGLGLAIVRHIAEMHGGTVFADSAGENQGSTFTVQLPITAAPPEDEDKLIIKNSSPDNLPLISLDGLLILVVDDEEDSRQLLVQSLTFYGATVVTAKSAAEGLNALQEKSPDVLVSDIGMPEEDGYSLIRKVRSLDDDRQKNTIAIALTAFTRAQDRMRALSAGFQNHVGKPVEPDELVTVIASLTGRLNEKHETE